MKFKKPKFWDYKKPSILSYLFLPISFLFKIFKSLKNLTTKKKKYSKIKTICVGNIYLGGTGKTSLSLKINEILKDKIKTCFIKKYYSDQIDEQKILANHGTLFKSKDRSFSIKQAIDENFELAIFDDGLQDPSIDYDYSIVCFNIDNWIGNSFTIPSGPLRENIKNLKKYKNVFLNGNNENIDNIKEYIHNIDSSINIYQGEYIPLNINEFEKDDKYLVFSGIGNHKTFISMLKKYNINIVKEIEFPDHYIYLQKEIDEIISISKNLNCKIMTTEKDYMRLNNNDKIVYIKSDLKIINQEAFVNDISKIYENN
ncbi:tetraacyldisaccharide 4'-kinase [Candidatus Pelagibacter sp.]|nr:tetraacyldisaccharide 4'-kinase [Candidatus Pelagibacter sp.]